MNPTTVEELIEILQKYPKKMKLYGYDGSDHDRPISVYHSDYANDEPDVLIISVCH